MNGLDTQTLFMLLFPREDCFLGKEEECMVDMD